MSFIPFSNGYEPMTVQYSTGCPSAQESAVRLSRHHGANHSLVDFWYLLISQRATVPGLYLWGFLTPPVAGADLRAALVASCFLGALPPVDLRAVCLVRAMVTIELIQRRVLAQLHIYINKRESSSVGQLPFYLPPPKCAVGKASTILLLLLLRWA